MTTTPEPLAFAVPPGWVRSVVVGNLGGESLRVLFYEDGTARFEHRCDRGTGLGRRGVIICAPALQLDGGHRIESEDPLTISPSILCSDCGTHGYVRNNRWVPA